MNIPSLSIAMNQSKLHHQVRVSVMKMAMESMKTQGIELAEMLETTTKIMEQSVNPHIGGNVDISI